VNNDKIIGHMGKCETILSKLQSIVNMNGGLLLFKDYLHTLSNQIEANSVHSLHDPLEGKL
jgi:hypothetical protein